MPCAARLAHGAENSQTLEQLAAAPAHPGAQHEPPDRHADRQRAPDAPAAGNKEAVIGGATWCARPSTNYPYRSTRERESVVVRVHARLPVRGLARPVPAGDRQPDEERAALAGGGHVRQPAGRPADRGRRAGSRGRIVFTDHGVGMDPNLQARIFEPFFSTDRGTGHGLGLAFCQRVIHGAGGTIRVKSELLHRARSSPSNCRVLH